MAFLVSDLTQSSTLVREYNIPRNEKKSLQSHCWWISIHVTPQRVYAKTELIFIPSKKKEYLRICC